MFGEVSVRVMELAACARVGAPLCIPMPADRSLQRLAEKQQLRLVGRRRGGTIETQWQDGNLWAIPPSTPSSGRFRLEVAPQPLPVHLRAFRDRTMRQILIEEGGRPVLQYNYWTVDRPDRHVQVAPENRIYSRPRSDYIHPLYGLQGEVLTEDWPADHPHHRGIYWAWPEVDYRGERGDLHALQHVFAYPTGRYRLTDGAVFAQVEAESVWRWENGDPIVLEWARIRAYRRTGQGRCIDLALFFTALKQPVLVARRGTNLYGGLNMRLAAIVNQRFVFHTEGERAWAGASGVFPEGDQPTTLLIFPHPKNPHHPPDWIEYPHLNWLQPAFPASGGRHELQPGQPLALRYRLWIRQGDVPPIDLLQAMWTAYTTMERGEEV